MDNISSILKQLPRHGQPIKPSPGQVGDGDYDTGIGMTGLGAGTQRPDKPQPGQVTDSTFSSIIPIIGSVPSQVNLGAGANISLSRDTVLSADSNTRPSAGSLAAQSATQLTIGTVGLLGNPLADSITSGVLNATRNAKPTEIYSLTSYKLLKDYPNSGAQYAKYRDFRWLSGFGKGTPRLDGTSATVNLGITPNPRTIAYAAANLLPGGVYSIFNRETLYGWGDHGSPSALRKDFTARTQVSTRWNGTEWKQDPAGIAFPFRGDKINVVDYGPRTLKNVYKWKPAPLIDLGIESDLFNEFDQTQDFIKFYFTGPKLSADKIDSTDIDDIIVFRATINSFTDSFTGGWESKRMIGRADPSYIYTGYDRSINFSFDINATSRDEMKPIWRKLNALASYTAPEYVDNAALKGPWMRFTMGDVFVQQPIILTSVQYTLQSTDTTWEINIEDDPTMMQAPKSISVTISANLITDTLPQKNGRMYSLAKQYENSIKYGVRAMEGSDNWLSGFEDNVKPIDSAEKTSATGVSDTSTQDSITTPLKPLIAVGTLEQEIITTNN